MLIIQKHKSLAMQYSCNHVCSYKKPEHSFFKLGLVGHLVLQECNFVFMTVKCKSKHLLLLTFELDG